MCYDGEENGHRVYADGHLTTADQSAIRETYRVSVI